MALAPEGREVFPGLTVRENPQWLIDEMDENDRLTFDTGQDLRDLVGAGGYAVCFAIAALLLFVGFYALFWGLGLV